MTDVDGNVSVNGSSNVLHRMGSFPGLDASVTYLFDRPIAAFGFDVNPHPDHVNNTVDFVTGTSGAGSFVLPGSDITEFRGSIFDTPFTSITFSMNSVSRGAWGSDNVAAFAPVSLPGTLALLSLGLAGFVVTRRKAV
ncbi:PEP-CTERM sorting domain-containing protein [Jannaschia seohaensis]|uniref:PEP-CTERM sorting domain-containing protein n=1 Tax=Jannaschia seohaensis TaxID=475081 RepID=UPI0014760955|nr:PEP-CTERM sorting domain-containing protein [Jannaschia seohaensis]